MRHARQCHPAHRDVVWSLDAAIHIVTHGSGVPAAKKATDAIPIIMARFDDADERGLVASLARPGGNVTGLSFQARELSGKWVQLLKEVRPRMTRVAILLNRGEPGDLARGGGQMRAAEAAIRSLQLSAQVLEVRGPADFDAAFASARRQKAEGAVILGSVIFTLNTVRLADLARTNQLPTIYYHRRFAEAGGLLAYGPKESDFDYRRVSRAGNVILVQRGGDAQITEARRGLLERTADHLSLLWHERVPGQLLLRIGGRRDGAVRRASRGGV